ncbi:hypothetical protein DAPPUDRAFT_117938 [Daphnia pulex]|uniref:Uncharacterized protein n=1 Tax=Daphnia pulex TaxID=6669 RepID=E9HU71_DAPPU|nr:hypothetical protein DAPPUDRAFT_117938 [Daphnia pulex]|eukprot:EFX64711.1 hypothetical protein DAPPUDRAFT_117938 [Daphnia pulex]
MAHGDRTCCSFFILDSKDFLNLQKITLCPAPPPHVFLKQRGLVGTGGRCYSASDTVSDSNSDSDESIEKSSRKREKFSRKRVIADQEDGELRLPEDPQHVEEEVPDNDAQDEIPGEPKEPKRPKLDVDVTEFRVFSKSSKKIRKWISKSFAKSKAKKLRERFQPKFSSSFELLNPEMDDSVYRRLKELKNSVATKEKIDNKEMEMRAMQFKILDIVRPMLFIWETAQEETNFDEKEFEMLFEDTFLNALLKTAKADAVLAAIPNGRNGGPSIRPSSGGRGSRGFHGTGSNQTNRFTGGQHQNGRGGFQFSNHQPFNHRGGGRGGFNNGRYVPEFASPLTLSIPVGGRLSHFSSRWTKITKDPWVLEAVTNGFKVEFSSPPHANLNLKNP